MKNINRKYHGQYRCKHDRPSSFWMQDPASVFGELNLKAGDLFLDLGCGLGKYTLFASGIVEREGRVYALDKSESLIANLKQIAATEGMANITATVADAIKPLPIRENCIDVCLVATVLHIPDIARNVKSLCAEIRRVLKPDGRLAIIECHKEDLTFGPPEYMRLSPEEVKDLMAQYDFKLLTKVDLGYNYLIQFVPI